ncbi:aspartate--tRNA ligase 2, cytoplasmic-like [Jatropha curcas]|uniref:aspartate--tRNA ligase 2, cytoplasmic-like n=1 Tax=Jatropha curcas TaxID=180498 RepID=UPI001893A056|nr:aspartate--tRNA ligase 2, cytoplasmic-like [Jatropha curcas]
MEERDLSRWTKVQDLTGLLKGKEVLIRGRAETIRVTKDVVLVVVRQRVLQSSFVFVLSSVPIKGTTQKVEVQVRKLHCISRAMLTLPNNIDVASRSEKEIEKARCLNYRVLDVRAIANQGIFHIQSINEDGPTVLELDYKGQPACLAQAPQLHKQMAICGDKERVFRVGPVFRAEDSYVSRLC